jgi:hypothetical protein
VISNAAVRKVVALEYAMLRTPLAAVDRQVAGRLAEDSRVRVPLQIGLGSLDALAGRLLGRPEPSGPSQQDEPAHDEAPTEEPQPDAGGSDEAQPARARATRAPRSRKQPAKGARTEAPLDEGPVEVEPDEVARVAETLREEQQETPVVGELADPELDVADVQAELRAKHLLQEQEEEQRRKQDGAAQ